VLLAAVLVYLNSLSNGFAFDDLGIIVDNATVHDLGNLLRIWGTPYWPGAEALDRGLYRPLTVFLFAVQWAMGQGSPLPFHVLNVLFHGLASLLVFRLIDGLVGWKGALPAALLFAVHPVHVEAVANVVGQAELVSAVGVLAACVAYAERPDHGKISSMRQVLILGFFLVALLAKEHAVVLPALLLALDGAQGRFNRPGYMDPTVRMAVAFLALVSVYLVLRFAVLGGSLTGDAPGSLGFLMDPPTRVRTALSVWPHYARLMVFPADLSAMYDPATIRPMLAVSPSVVAGGILLLAVLATMATPSAWPVLGLGSAWFMVTILPVSNLLVPIGTVLAERTLYLPSVAGAIWVAYGLRRLLESPSRPGWQVLGGAVGIAVVAVGLGLKTIDRNPVWADNQVLFRITLEDHPESFRAQWFEARRLTAAGDLGTARQHWERAFEIYPDHAVFLVDYTGFLLSEEDLEGAEKVANRALEIQPQAASVLFTGGLVDIAGNRPDDAATRAGELRARGFDALAGQLEDSIRAGRGRDTR
jgi:hypothetical protein